MVEPLLPLQIHNATVTKRGKTLLGPLDMEISGRGTTIIMGPNGTGKTTLLRLMHGLERPRTGSVEWNIGKVEARTRQAFVFQTPIMLRRKTIDNVTYPLLLKGKDKKTANTIATQWLERIGLTDVAGLEATFLSGGEKQKLAVARALACEPDILFLDEPTANLDGRATREIETMLKEAGSSGLRVVMTTHDAGQARRLADDVVFIYRGKLHEQASADSFFAAPQTSQASAFLNGEIVE